MKKLCTLALVTLLLFGCGGKKDVVKQTKTCTLKSGVSTQVYEIQGEDDEVTHLLLTSEVEAKSLKLGVDFKDITADQYEYYKEVILQESDIKEVDGVKIDVSFTELSAIIKMDIDMKKVDSDFISSINIPYDDSLTFDDFVNELIRFNAECN